jgi:hypothetical protein
MHKNLIKFCPNISTYTAYCNKNRSLQTEIILKEFTPLCPCNNDDVKFSNEQELKFFWLNRN